MIFNVFYRVILINLILIYTYEIVSCILTDNVANETKIFKEKGDFDVSTEEEDYLDVKTKLVRKAKLK